jgi:3-methylfumaryl-CoA hydratase
MRMSAVDAEALQQWVGRTQVRNDVICAAPAAALSATLDYAQPLAVAGVVLPTCWHWLYFLDTAPASGLGVDGHAKRGDFLPPVPLPRRMWAGGRLRFASPLVVGDAVRRHSTVSAVSHKQGRTGDLVFVTVRHAIYRGDTLAIEEEQDLVYRGQGADSAAPASAAPISEPGSAPTSVLTPAPPSAPPAAQWSRELLPDPVLLFRYSALTFNSHRIHYDRAYATGEEGYASLVVQGPLSVTLLLDLLRRQVPGADIAQLEFRARGPLLEGVPLQLQGRQDEDQVRLWALDANGLLAMDVQARLNRDT